MPRLMPAHDETYEVSTDKLRQNFEGAFGEIPPGLVTQGDAPFSASPRRLLVMYKPNDTSTVTAQAHVHSPNGDCYTLGPETVDTEGRQGIGSAKGKGGTPRRELSGSGN